MSLPDIDTDFFTFLKSVRAKLRTHPFISKDSNVKIGDSLDIFSLPDENFPRFEIRPTRDLGNGYESQRNLKLQYDFVIVGFLRRPSDEITETDIKNVVAFGEKTRALIYEFNDDTQLDKTQPSPGFDYMDDYPVLDMDFEIMEKTSVIIFTFRAHASSKDTKIVKEIL